MSDLKAEIKGLKETQANMTRIVRELRGRPMLNAMRKATLLVQRAAKRNAPVDTGRLRASITPEVSMRGKVLQGIVGTNVIYAREVEQPGPVRRTGRRPYLQPALEENQRQIADILDGAVGRIVSK